MCTSLDSLFIDKTQHHLERNNQYMHLAVLSIQVKTTPLHRESVKVFSRSESLRICISVQCRQMHQACQHRNNSTPCHKMQVTFIFRHRSSKVSRCKDIPIHYSNRSKAEIKLARQILSCAQVQSGFVGYSARRFVPLNSSCLPSRDFFQTILYATSDSEVTLRTFLPYHLFRHKRRGSEPLQLVRRVSV